MTSQYQPNITAMRPIPRKAAYGGVTDMRMTAPVAPGSQSAQGRAVAGQGALPEYLTLQAQNTMGVPHTPVKGLLPRLMPGFDGANSGSRMG